MSDILGAILRAPLAVVTAAALVLGSPLDPRARGRRLAVGGSWLVVVAGLGAAGALRRTFALSAGWGDIAVGLLAILVAWLVHRGAPHEVAVSGTIATPPWVLIPGFLVPLYLLTHLAVFEARLLRAAPGRVVLHAGH